jgi:hypothetical protein
MYATYFIASAASPPDWRTETRRRSSIRRTYPVALSALIAAACGQATAPTLQPAAIEEGRRDAISATYAESAAVVAMTEDGSTEIAMRIARFPGRGEATLWLAAYVGDRSWGLAQEDLELGKGAGVTGVEDAEVSFAVTGTAQALIACRNRHTPMMTCMVRAAGLAHESLDPPLGKGTIPLRVGAEFRARHVGDRARPGRLEIFGTVKATIESPDGTHRFESLGKYHEQTGERPSFAGAFTYFAVQGEGASLLARSASGATWGFALVEGETVAVETFTIDPFAVPQRAFRVELADGRTIEGRTEIVRLTSVPIEGERRPSATVRVNTNLGPMVGHLNDWKPSA